MLNPTTATSTRAQLADSDEAILAFAVTFREPDATCTPATSPGGSPRRSGSRSATSSPASGLL